MDSESDKTSRCLLIAPLKNHAVVGRVAALAATRYSLFVVDVSINKQKDETCYPFNQIQKMERISVENIDPIYRSSNRMRIVVDCLRSRKLLQENFTLRKEFSRIIEEINPAVIITHYGRIAMHYARIVKRINSKIPVICILNLLPSTIEFRKGLLKYAMRLLNQEFSDYKNWLKVVDGIVYASQEMKEFAERRFSGITDKTIICPDFLPASFQAKQSHLTTGPIKPQNPEPKLIFMGAPERWGAMIDNIDDQLLELANEKIHIYSGAMSDAIIATGYGHLYPRFTDLEVFTGKLSDYASQFDAVLITYGISGRHERFRSTYPTRFFTALTTENPVIIRRGLLDACERFIQDHGIGFSFDNVHELREKLQDKELLNKCRSRMCQLRRITTAEVQGPELENFIDYVASK